MIKRILSFICAILLYCSNPSAQISDRQRDEVVGSVRRVIVRESDQSLARNEPVLSRLVAYDSKGNIVETIHYDGRGEYLWRWTSEFNADGRLTKFATYDKDFSLNKTYTTHYDGDGKKVSEVEYEGEKLKLAGRKVYRTLGRNGSIEEVSYDLRGRPVFRRLTRYDPAGNKIEESQHTTRYGSFSAHGADRWTYEYDSSGYLKAWHFFEGAYYVGKCVYIRDSKGNTIEEKWYDNDNQLQRTTSFTHEFDPRGNWISRTARTTAETGDPLMPYVPKITIREIIYF